MASIGQSEVLWRRGAFRARGVALLLLLVCVLISSATHTHAIYRASNDKAPTARARHSCAACVMETNGGMAPAAAGVVTVPVAFISIEAEIPAVVSAFFALSVGRAPPSA